MELKGDSALLNQRKPLFLPDWTHDVRYTPAKIVRICRLGKNIQPKFAHRYYDAVADAMDVVAWDKLENNPAMAVSFDGSMVVGDWTQPEPPQTEEIAINEAIAKASEVMTLRMGDLIFMDQDTEALPLQREDVIEYGSLYCKIK